MGNRYEKPQFVSLLCREIPVDENRGPNALASAPSDLKIPITVPFCSLLPYDDITVVMHGTTVEEAAKVK